MNSEAEGTNVVRRKNRRRLFKCSILLVSAVRLEWLEYFAGKLNEALVLLHTYMYLLKLVATHTLLLSSTFCNIDIRAAKTQFLD